MTGSTLHFRVPSGIGDISWLYSKLVSLDRPLSIEVVGAKPQRSLPFLRMLPNVVKAEYGTFTTRQVLENGDKGGYTAAQLIAEAEQGPVYLQMNHWLEAGNRIEGYLPDVKTAHHYSIHIPWEEAEQAHQVVSWPRYLTLYCANDHVGRNWGGLVAQEWADLGVQIVRHFELDGIVLIGAEWDKNMADCVQCAIGYGAPVINAAGTLPLGATLDVVRRGSYTVAFPSGIPILASVMHCPVLMFYPKALEPMMLAWPHHLDIENGRYTGMIFCPPERVMIVLKDKYINSRW